MTLKVRSKAEHGKARPGAADVEAEIAKLARAQRAEDTTRVRRKADAHDPERLAHARSLGDVASTRVKRRQRLPKGIRVLPGDEFFVPKEWSQFEEEPAPASPAVLYAAKRMLHLAAEVVQSGTARPFVARALLAADRSFEGYEPARAWLATLHTMLYAAWYESEQRRASKQRARAELELARIIVSALEDTCHRYGVALPAYIADANVVAWLLARYSPGGGGGPSKKLKGESLLRLAEHPQQLAAAIAKERSLKALADRVRARAKL